MAQTSLNLLEHVLPPVPLRQFVLTVPFELRTRLAYDRDLLGRSCRLFVDSVLAWYRRHLRRPGAPAGWSGAVTVVQRSSADLRFNPHFHAVVLDGVFVPAAEGVPVFEALPHLDTADVADLLQTVRARLLGLLRRRGVLETGPEPTLLDDPLAEREPALAHLAAAAVRAFPREGLDDAGRRAPLLLRARPRRLGRALEVLERHGPRRPRGRPSKNRSPGSSAP